MPYPSEHAARLLDPNTPHVRVRRSSGSGGGRVHGAKVPGSIDVIWYVVKTSEGREAPVAQALRFPTRRWTAEQARAWLKENEIKPKLFEPAAKSKNGGN